MGLKTFFTYFGSKVRDAKYYPAPKYDTIIEPFAGAAGYSLMHYQKNVILVDADPVIAGIWDYLIKAAPDEIRKLPLTLLSGVSIPQEAKWLIGFWYERGHTKPGTKASSWMTSGKYPTAFWGEHIRERIASQVDKIKHWKIYNTDYNSRIEPPSSATIFVDPPYQKQGKSYSVKFNDYESLEKTCLRLSNNHQIIVCEQDGANWLPFRPLKECLNSKRQKRMEVMWTNDTGEI